jgi:hypothetical protein
VAKVAVEVTDKIAKTKAENAKNHNNTEKVALKGTMKWPPLMLNFVLEKIFLRESSL